MGAKIIRTVANVFLTAGIVMLFLACGPSCPEVKGALDEETIIGEDVARVNAFVEKRKAAIAEAKSGQVETFPMQRLKFSVTADEMAVWVQAHPSTRSTSRQSTRSGAISISWSLIRSTRFPMLPARSFNITRSVSIHCFSEKARSPRASSPVISKRV